MFLKNAWYCGGWDYEVHQGRDAIVSRMMAGERVVLYRKPDGGVVALEDRCPHRQAALSLGRKEGNSLRCLYHGMKFNSEGVCEEFLVRRRFRSVACVRSYPVVEKDNWIWGLDGRTRQGRSQPDLLFGRAERSQLAYQDLADARGDQLSLGDRESCRSQPPDLGPSEHGRWRSCLWRDQADPHHHATRPQHGVLGSLGCTHRIGEAHLPGGHEARYLLRHPAHRALQLDHAVPRLQRRHQHEGESNGQLLVDTWTCQAVTPRDEDSVDYYYSWGASKETEIKGLSDLLGNALDEAFTEDKTMLEAQHLRRKEKPNLKMINISHDAGRERCCGCWTS